MTDTETITTRPRSAEEFRDKYRAMYPNVPINEKLVEGSCQKSHVPYEAPLEIMTFERFEARIREDAPPCCR